MMEKNRGLRRHHSERIKRRVAGHYGGYAKGDPRLIGKLATTRTPCSCYCCGNPRKHFGQETIAESGERQYR